MRIYYLADYDQNKDYFDSLQKAIEHECRMFQTPLRENVLFDIEFSEDGHSARIRCTYNYKFAPSKLFEAFFSIVSAEVK